MVNALERYMRNVSLTWGSDAVNRRAAAGLGAHSVRVIAPPAPAPRLSPRGTSPRDPERMRGTRPAFARRNFSLVPIHNRGGHHARSKFLRAAHQTRATRSRRKNQLFDGRRGWHGLRGAGRSAFRAATVSPASRARDERATRPSEGGARPSHALGIPRRGAPRRKPRGWGPPSGAARDAAAKPASWEHRP